MQTNWSPARICAHLNAIGAQLPANSHIVPATPERIAFDKRYDTALARANEILARSGKQVTWSHWDNHSIVDAGA